MRALVLYDSNYGNTKKIAEAIASELGSNVSALSLKKFTWNDLKRITLLIVGCPIHGWRPTEAMGKLLDSLEPNQLQGIQAATFDTRIDVILHGDAKNKIAKKLKNAGATLISDSQAFYVKGMEGPLVAGELEKAKAWAQSLLLLEK